MKDDDVIKEFLKRKTIDELYNRRSTCDGLSAAVVRALGFRNIERNRRKAVNIWNRYKKRQTNSDPAFEFAAVVSKSVVEAEPVRRKRRVVEKKHQNTEHIKQVFKHSVLKSITCFSEL